MATTTTLVQTLTSLSQTSNSTALAQTPSSKPTASTPQSSSSFHPPLAHPAYPPSPGNWRHPRLTEIARRQSAATFSSRDLRRAVLNAVALFLSFFFTSSIYTALDYSTSLVPLIEPADTSFYTLNTVRLYFLYNFACALLPLLPNFFPNLKPKDQITDIPLTPSQRYLLGLDPSIPSEFPDDKVAKPASATGSPYITPPRYRRSSGSTFSNTNNNSISSPLDAATTTDRRSISATYYSSSPLSPSRNFSPSSALSPFRSPSLGTNNINNGSHFSPSASPLLHKAIAPRRPTNYNNNNNTTIFTTTTTTTSNREVADLDRRRSSLGTSSFSLGRSQSVREHGAKAGGGETDGARTDSPSPSGRPRRHPHLNYKWLYEKGARLPRSETMQF